MNKQQFLKELIKLLAHLPQDERQDILRDMEEFFYEGVSRGESEEEIIKKLGSPKKMADTILAEAKIKRLKEATTIPHKIKAFFGAFFAILLLTPFNLIFVLLPVFLATLFIVVGWPIVLTIALTLPIVWLVAILLAFQVGFHLFALLTLICFSIGWLGFVVAMVVGFSQVTGFYFKCIGKLFQWNIQFIKNRMRG